MKNIRNLETKYLQAKIEYYEGKQSMSDAEFDRLENELKNLGSKVIEQIGHKRSDFDFPHPTKMLSLDKIQTEEIDDEIDYKETEFLKWYDKMVDILRKNGISEKEIDDIFLIYSPKFDGNGINIIYINGELSVVLTRGDGFMGKNVTDRFFDLLPKYLNADHNILENKTLEIRCEVVMDIKDFDKINEDRVIDGLEPLANSRNATAGWLSGDEFDPHIMKKLILKPLHFILDGEQVEEIPFINNDYYYNVDIYKDFHYCDYADVIKSMIEFRKNSNVQLDGVVINFPIKYNEILGIHNSGKFPNYGIAVKYVPEEVTTEVLGVEWNVGRSGELSPVVLLKPVELAQTIVKRASGYNAGYILSEGLGTGSVVSICKAGDIIPEIQTVISSNFDITLPEFCPDCGTKLYLEDIHLRCPNPECLGKLAKILHATAKAIDIRGCGSEVFKKFGSDFNNLYDLLCFVLGNQDNHQGFVKYGFKPNSRSLQIFIAAFTNIKSLTYAKAILLFGFQNVGLKLGEQVAKLYNGIEPDFSGQQKALVEFFQRETNMSHIRSRIFRLEEFFNIKIDKPKNNNLNSNIMETNVNQEAEMKSIYVCMTGSPKSAGWETKKEFLNDVDIHNFDFDFVDCEITNKECKYLVTNDLSSSTSKMKEATKRNIPILTYEEFAEKFGN